MHQFSFPGMSNKSDYLYQLLWTSLFDAKASSKGRNRFRNAKDKIILIGFTKSMDILPCFPYRECETESL